MAQFLAYLSAERISFCQTGPILLNKYEKTLCKFNQTDMNTSNFECKTNQLPTCFFAQNSRIVAQQLLGKILVHDFKGYRLAGKIVETEAYCDFHTVCLLYTSPSPRDRG